MALLDLLVKVPMSVIPFQYKRKPLLFLVGVLATVLLLPIVLVQVIRSWHLATIKIREGKKIPQWVSSQVSNIKVAPDV
ncbi:MAG TPA: hypothetical protein DHV26_11430 [Cytophagales bacterium]|nr:hypothetical protein [Cytophagales bacterium]